MATTTSAKTIAYEYGLKGSNRELFKTACTLHIWVWIATRMGRTNTPAARNVSSRLAVLRTQMRNKNVRAAFRQFVQTHPIGAKIQLVQLVDEARYFDRDDPEDSARELDPDQDTTSEDGTEGTVSLRDIGDLSWDPNSY